MTTNKKFILKTSFVLTLVLMLFAGYVMNVVKLVNADFESPYKTEVIRTVGLFPFVGVFIGWMDIGEENK